ncbi:putative reverse transcriptase and RNase H [Colletotrichum somersetense]|nr:putative reverse transcriptase and RNase H [Colletotrichum somersetense]
MAKGSKMIQRAEPQSSQDMPGCGWHFGSTDTAQQFFCFPPPPSYFPPFFDYYDNQQRDPAYRYESPLDVYESTDFQPLDSLSLRCAEEESDYAPESALDLSPSDYPVLCEEDQFIVSARAESRKWGEIQTEYEARFGASRSSTRQALAMKLCRLKQKYPELTSVVGHNQRKTRRRRCEEAAGGIRGSSRGDAIAAAQTLLDFLGQPDNGKLVSQADCLAVVRIISQLYKEECI